MTMPEFTYKARGLDGRNVQGVLAAASRRDAIAILGQQSLCPQYIADKSTDRPRWSLQLARRRSVRAEHVAACLSQLSDLLENGVPLLQSLGLLAEQTPDATLRDVLTEVRDDVSEGVPLDQAAARHPRVFSELTVSMIRAGSEGAFLEDALRRIATFLELQEELKGKVKGAMAYPLFLMIGGIVVTLVLVVFFVPKFEGLFIRLERQGTGLPLATHLLLGMSDFLLRFGWTLLLVLAGVVVSVRHYLQTDGGRLLTDRWKLRLPLAGRIYHETALSRFCRVLGTLLHNGVPILKALQISSDSVGNRILAQAIRDSAENISSGQALSQPLAASGLIPPATMAMIRVAEESNSLDTVLVNIADVMDKRVERKLTLMVRFIEPVMLVLIGGAILFVLVALLLPVFDMSTAL